jgi:hypothetical protein
MGKLLPIIKMDKFYLREILKMEKKMEKLLDIMKMDKSNLKKLIKMGN